LLSTIVSQARVTAHSPSLWRCGAGWPFSFSVKPRRLVTWIGLLAFLLGFASGVVYRLMTPDEFNKAVAGWGFVIYD
jgi:hypothetical protein